ncbi:hypothetical protein [Bacillus nitratireducens]|uniref:hypothetical protein n=1 Tax=Bacillus nitratireducens TaxID=2026193 RepID=UPI0015D4CE81|nr:hypothetical protein [Bacillus nitratireducens]
MDTDDSVKRGGIILSDSNNGFKIQKNQVRRITASSQITTPDKQKGYAPMEIFGTGNSGFVDVLNNIGRVLHQELGIGVKKLQTNGKIPQAKTIYYQSKKEISLILEFAGVLETLEEFNDLNLGYVDTNMTEL